MACQLRGERRRLHGPEDHAGDHPEDEHHEIGDGHVPHQEVALEPGIALGPLGLVDVLRHRLGRFEPGEKEGDTGEDDEGRDPLVRQLAEAQSSGAGEEDEA